MPGSESSPQEEYGNPLQDSCLENPMDRGAREATVHGVTTAGHDLVTKQPLKCIPLLSHFVSISMCIFMHVEVSYVS